MVTTVNYATLATSAPINADAAKIRDGGGEHYVSRKKFSGDHWTAPQPLRPVPWNCPDLTGKKLGRLTVVGLLDGSRHAKGARWLVRCTCGDYESRRSKALTNPKNAGDRCDVCRHKVYLQREQVYLRTGKDKDVSEFLKD